MHFDPRTQAALREVGLDEAELRAASDHVAAAVAADAAALESFFGTAEEADAYDGAAADEDGGNVGADDGAAADTFYSDMEMAHSATDVQEHTVDHVDVYTHAADLRGYLRFDSWGVPIEDGRVLVEGEGDADPPDVVELSLGPTVNDRVRFARSRDAL
ncbi:hypothetical protein ACFO0N_09765 [Halobium salinum]|uniref:Uncharacterized protein n=1 Tax=Halobium salinum TaxID=1364940 RepID=A0ABD5PC35_9EURY|nr:hypothetical protein [Halobium salinum]